MICMLPRVLQGLVVGSKLLVMISDLESQPSKAQANCRDMFWGSGRRRKEGGQGLSLL